MLSRFFFLFLLFSFGLLSAQTLSNNSLTEIQGRVYVDINENGNFDTDDVALDHVEVITTCPTETGFASTNAEGQYVQPITKGDICTLALRFENRPEIEIPVHQTIDLTQNLDALGYRTYDFRLSPRKTSDHGIQLELVRLSSFEVGRPALFELIVYNNGVFRPQDTVSLSIEAPFSFYDAVVPPIGYSNDYVSWQIPSLKPFQSWRTKLQLLVAASDQAYGNQSSGYFTASSISGNQETNFEYLIDYADQPEGGITANSKNIIGGLTYTQRSIKEGSSVLYLIRFQNTTNELVENVTIFDTLDMRLEASDFEMVNSSHPYQIIKDADNSFRWLFQDINLTDSLSDAEGSEGHILFRVPITKNVIAGESVQNKAFIKLDNHPKIMTNTAVFSVVDDSKVSLMPKGIVQLPSPNPTLGTFSLDFPDVRLDNVEVYDAQGRFVHHCALRPNRAFCDISKKPAGVYFVRVIEESNIQVYQVVRL